MKGFFKKLAYEVLVDAIASAAIVGVIASYRAFKGRAQPPCRHWDGDGCRRAWRCPKHVEEYAEKVTAQNIAEILYESQRAKEIVRKGRVPASEQVDEMLGELSEQLRAEEEANEEKVENIKEFVAEGGLIIDRDEDDESGKSNVMIDMGGRRRENG